MTYATVADLKAVIPAQDLKLLTDFDGPIDQVDDTWLQAALDDATAEINGYIAKQLKTVIGDPPRMLKVLCRDLALQRLYVNSGAVAPDAIEKLREGALAYLKSVAHGEVSIGDETLGDEIQTSPGVVIDEGADPVFTRDTLKGF